jgi:hypothetical protein
VTRPIRAYDVKPEPVDWLWKGRVPRGTLSFVAGRPDVGKGLWAVHVASEMSRAGEKVLYSAAEDAHALMTRPRLEAAGAHTKDVHLWRFRLPSQLDALFGWIEKEQYRLIIIDPVAATFERSHGRHGDAIREPLSVMQDFAENHPLRPAFLFVDHTLKRPKTNGHPLDIVGGSSSGLPAACRMGFVFGSDPGDEDSRYLACIKSNLREKPQAIRFEIEVTDTELVANVPSLVMTDEDVDFDPMRLFEKRSGGVGRPPDKRSQAAQWLTEYLLNSGQPVQAGKILEDAKHYGMTQKTLRRAADDMEIVRNPAGGGRNCTWDLPKQLRDRLSPPKLEQPKPGVSEDELRELAHTEGLPEDSEPTAEPGTSFDDEIAKLLGDQPPEEPNPDE